MSIDMSKIDQYKQFKAWLIDSKTGEVLDIPHFIISREKLIKTIILLAHEYPNALIKYEGCI